MIEHSTSFSLLFSRIFRDLPSEFSAKPAHFRAFGNANQFSGDTNDLWHRSSPWGRPAGLLNFRLERRIV
jgi:hypothetical protein